MWSVAIDIISSKHKEEARQHCKPHRLSRSILQSCTTSVVGRGPIFARSVNREGRAMPNYGRGWLLRSTPLVFRQWRIPGVVSCSLLSSVSGPWSVAFVASLYLRSKYTRAQRITVQHVYILLLQKRY